jgi:hypothetical protein
MFRRSMNTASLVALAWKKIQILSILITVIKVKISAQGRN